jgi:hypothetical protein
MSNFSRKVRTSQRLWARTGVSIVLSGISTRTPRCRIAATCSGHWWIRTTSRPARVKSAPIDAPLAATPRIAVLLGIYTHPSRSNAAPSRRGAFQVGIFPSDGALSYGRPAEAGLGTIAGGLVDSRNSQRKSRSARTSSADSSAMRLQRVRHETAARSSTDCLTALT